MPDGYLVSLGNSSLDVGDGIVDPLVTFTTQTYLGDGQWTWSGTFGGTTFTNETEPGRYELGTDGNVYFVPAFGPVTTITSADVTSAPSYSDNASDNVVTGTDAADVIDTSYSDAEGDTVDDGSGFGTGGLGDFVRAGSGDDQVLSGDGDDLVLGQSGDDTIDGGAGDDTIVGDSETTVTTESLDWLALGANGTDLSSGFTQNTGSMDVTVSFTDDGNNNPTFLVDSSTVYVDTGEPYGTNSSLRLFGQGGGATSTTSISFSGAAGAAEDEVTNVSFRINDIDFASGNHRDIVTVNAFDAAGAPVAITFTPSGGDTVSGNTITADNVLDDPDDAGGSVLIEIAGPVQSIEIIYGNGLNNTQAINVSDLYYDATELASAGDDVLTGGTGADILDGGLGDDILNVGSGDTARGGDGDDTFLIDSSALGGGDITIVGGEGAETGGDTLDFNGALDNGTLNITNPDDGAGGLSGTALLIDGTVVTFSEIETIICFTEGTLIQTPNGDRRVESLAIGDLVCTFDSGPKPIRWIGQKTVRATGALAPVRFCRGTLGNHSDLLVSPQHRMLCSGAQTQLNFGESQVLAPAKGLVDDQRVTVEFGGMVTYVHIMFDQHEVVVANGALCESFHPGGVGIATLTEPSREELFRLFPALRSDIGSYGPASRPCLKTTEARALVLN